ncbi:hypothetical protein CDL12_15834 [Handroanthus impetiginosus]|uniref:DUF7794 domain-containing protein n=1 Tax=Handroanthus impetiginosus TaxID=429701 RepID=A0A2G9H233_9LAMI|nr:hypothetical protein CDL12_15834 [Handroanthus impetiginosus]
MLIKSLFLSLSRMDPRKAYSLTVLFILSLLSFHSKVIYGDSTVFFLDSPSRHYLRHSPSQALQDHYGNDGIAQSALEVFVNSISKTFDSLQAAYQGKIVGVIAHGGLHESELENMFHVTVASRPSARLLEETEAAAVPTKLAEVVFVRKTLAWVTGIILLIATLLGILFLLNMPLTKDTLLYSNVKLD